LKLRKLITVGVLSLSLIVGSTSAFAASIDDTLGLDSEVAINKLVALNVFAKADSFRPEAPLTRSDLSYLLVRVLPLKTPAKQPQIADVATANGANSHIAKVVGNGYLMLQNGKFNPKKGVTFGELSKALAYGLGFKASWSTRPIDAFFYLERKGVLSINTDLDAVVTREDAAVVLDKFLDVKGSYIKDAGVVSAILENSLIINNGSEYAEYALAPHAALFINGQSEELSTFGPGTAVNVILNAKGELAYVEGSILGMVSGTITMSSGKVKINDALKNADLNAVVDALPNDPEGTFTLTTFGKYAAAGVTFAGNAFINEGNDEVTMLDVYMSKAEDRAFSAAGTTITLDFSEDAIANQSFEIAEDAKILLVDKEITLSELVKLQTTNTLSGTVEMDESGVVTSIVAKAEPKKAE